MSKKEVGVDVKDCYNSLENYNSSVKDLWADVREWLKNVESWMGIVDGIVFR